MISPTLPPDAHPASVSAIISNAATRSMPSILKHALPSAGAWRDDGGRRRHAIRRRCSSGQEAAREQENADDRRHQHGADDAEPFFVWRRVRDPEFRMIAHR